jgi:hypothetical protein
MTGEEKCACWACKLAKDAIMESYERMRGEQITYWDVANAVEKGVARVKAERDQVQERLAAVIAEVRAEADALSSGTDADLYIATVHVLRAIADRVGKL